jgi:allantoate deiminase
LPDGEAVRIDPGLVEHYVATLAQYGAHGETGVWRTCYDPNWVAAQRQITAWCEEAGLAARWDAVGNVWGRLEGTEPGPVIATGSHIDSQTPGGRFDGALGAIAGIIALRTLKERFGPPRRTLECVSFCEEETSRFPGANFWGSRAITGAIEPDEPEQIRGYDGVTIGEAMRGVGLDPARIPEARRTDVDSFIELHVEQGPILEQEGLPVGIVTAIVGLRQYLVELTGRTDHAGGVPIDMRLDAMAGAAEVINTAINTAVQWGRPAVTTVGRMFVEPNLTGAVPGKVTFGLDARHPDPEQVHRLYALHEGLIRDVAERRGLGYGWRLAVNHEPCLSDPGLVAALEKAARDQGIPARTMHSGAGHDTQRMANIAKVAMIFVQSRGGRSHTPEEFTSAEHAAAGIQVLAAALHDLAY